MNRKITLQEVAELVGGRLEGDGSVAIEGIASLEEAQDRHLTFVAEAKHLPRLAASKAAGALAGEFAIPSPTMPLIRVGNVQAALAALLAKLSPGDDLPPRGVHLTATVAPDAQLSQDVAVGPGAVVGSRAIIGRGSVLCANTTVGADVVIGENTILFEGVVVRWGCRLGSHVRIGPNSVIGFDGFGYFFADGRHHRVPHIGQVIIEDAVELGACVCVDRAKFGVTRIGAGTKIDNQVQIAHNVNVGANCLMAAQVGIAGSTKLGDFVVLGGGVGIRDNITLGSGVQCTAFAAVAGDMPDGAIIAGVPAGPARDKFREMQAVTKLPDLLKRVRELEARLIALESAKDH